ncbi:MAG: prephenate dehydrogenase/arogenate dehydrogenase family protein [Anaerolineae bacterium]|nr:prephenate dehydrogenase/arogenate dehydrogenase family protein [Anaerolineae bacterium]
MANVNVTVLGMNRLGTSFGLAIRALNGKPDHRHTFKVTGCDRRAENVRKAAELGALDAQQLDFVAAVRNADIVLLCVPYSETEDVLKLVGGALKAGAVVLDSAPLKVPSLAWAERYLLRDSDGDQQAYLVGITPILNPSYLGLPEDSPESGRADLFQDGVMIIAPAPNCPPDAVQLVSDLSDLLGVKVHFTDPAEHDSIAAGMEGLPLLLQVALFKALRDSPSWKDAQWFGNPSFVLATYRLIESDPEALGALLYRNRQNLMHRLDALMAQLAHLRDMLQVEDDLLIGELFQAAMNDYAEWHMARLRNKYNTEPDLSEAADQARSSLSLFGAFLPSFRPRGKEKKSRR